MAMTGVPRMKMMLVAYCAQTKSGKPEPGHARGAHGVDGDDEIQPGQDGRKTVDEDADDGGRHGGVRIDAAERRIESPTSIQAAGGEGIEHEAAAGDVNVPAQQVELGKSDVFRANHQGNEEVSEHGGNGRNQEEENHGHAVHGKELVVSLRRNQVTGRRKQVNADHGGEDAADEKEESDGSKIKQRDALVVGGQQPGTDAVRGIEIMLFRQFDSRALVVASCSLWYSWPISSPVQSRPHPSQAPAAIAAT